MRARTAVACAVALWFAAATGTALAQDQPLPAGPPQEVSGPEISMLIRTTVVALHHANVTGNYTVLRDLGSRDLQAANTAARLTDLFREFRETGLNLAPAILYDPMLDQDPLLTTDGILRLVGHFPTDPQEIIFDLTFRYERSAWRISVISVGTRAAGDAEQVLADRAGSALVPAPRLRPAASDPATN